jgi:uncharacterized repeat protein (TIGR01451 family)
MGALLLTALVFVSVGSAAQPGSADLRIAKSDGPDPVRVGGALTYTIDVVNLGPSPATGVTVTDNLPRGVDLISASGPAGNCPAQGGKVTCAIGWLNPVWRQLRRRRAHGDGDDRRHPSPHRHDSKHGDGQR